LQEGYKMLTFQPIEKQNLDVLLRVYNESLATYKRKPAEVDSILAYEKTPSAELAALTISANVMLNLDKVVTKE
jgi:hypothetical protein